MGPFRRGRDTPSPAPEPDPGPAGWETLPPLPVTVGPPPPTFKVGAAVKEDLAALRSPRLSSGLGHLVSPDAPRGSVTGLVTPAAHVQRRPDSALELRQPPVEGPTVQRHFDGPPGPVSHAVIPATAGQRQPAGPAGSVSGHVIPAADVPGRSDSALELGRMPAGAPAVQRRPDLSTSGPEVANDTDSSGLSPAMTMPDLAGPVSTDLSSTQVQRSSSGDAIGEEAPAVEAMSSLTEGPVQRLSVDTPIEPPKPPVQRQPATDAIGHSPSAGMPELVPLRRVLAVDPSFTPPPRPVEATDPAPAVRAEPPPPVVEPPEPPEPEAPAVEPEPAQAAADEFAIVQRSRSNRSTPVQRSPDAGTGLQRIVELPTLPPLPTPGETPRSPGVQRRDTAPEAPPVQRMASDVAGPPVPAPDLPYGPPIRPVGVDVPAAPPSPAPSVQRSVTPSAAPLVPPAPSIQRSDATARSSSDQRSAAPTATPLVPTFPSVQRSATASATPVGRPSPSVQRSEAREPGPVPESVAPLSSSVERSVAAARIESVQRVEARDPAPAAPLSPPQSLVGRPSVVAPPVLPLASSVQRSVMPTPLAPGIVAAPRTDRLPVARQEMPEPSPAPEAPIPSPAPSPPPPAPAAQPPAAVAAAPAAAAAATGDLDELARKLYDRIRWRLRAELRLDLERAGLAAGLRR